MGRLRLPMMGMIRYRPLRQRISLVHGRGYMGFISKEILLLCSYTSKSRDYVYLFVFKSQALRFTKWCLHSSSVPSAQYPPNAI